jgi:hypothetical protein
MTFPHYSVADISHSAVGWRCEAEYHPGIRRSTNRRQPGASGLNDAGLRQGMLFDQQEREKQSRVDSVADQLKERFGTGAIRRDRNLRPLG